jgi:hypothetical protein
VLYGASTFSEDVDIWVEPTAVNWQRLLAALRQIGARVYKLTPPLTLEYARRGHGFHFTVPDKDSPSGIGYVDVMAIPPRVGSFREAAHRAQRFTTDWGRIPVVAPVDLVLLKKTRRLADYAVISALVRLASRKFHSSAQWQWALEQTFEAEDLLSFWQRGRAAWRKRLMSPRPVLRQLRTARLQPSHREIARALLAEMEQAREADRLYWQPVLAELRNLQRHRHLISEGILVKSQDDDGTSALLHTGQTSKEASRMNRRKAFQRSSPRS